MSFKTLRNKIPFSKSSQIEQIYNQGIYGRPVNYKDLMGWWPLYGNALDYSGYGTDGIFINMSP